MTSLYYDRQGQPISRKDWSALFNDVGTKRVALDEINGVRISTVWLGLNHAWIPGQLEIFETMTFSIDPGFNEYQWRYATEADAIAGHNKVCREIRDGKLLAYD